MTKIPPRPIIGPIRCCTRLCGKLLQKECKTRIGEEFVVSIIHRCLTPIARRVGLRAKAIEVGIGGIVTSKGLSY